MTALEQAEREAVRLREGDHNKVLFWLWPPYGPPDTPTNVPAILQAPAAPTMGADMSEQIVERLEQYGNVAVSQITGVLSKRRYWLATLKMRQSGAETRVATEGEHATMREALVDLERRVEQFRRGAGDASDWRAA